jgi:hypothetical protein
MRSPYRTIIVLLVAIVLVALFLWNVDVAGVLRSIIRAHPGWLLVSLGTMLLNLFIRAWRWQYLLEPVGHVPFGSAFRATSVGFAARSVLPAAAGEMVRAYFLSRCERVSATGAFATVILERLLDMVTVLLLLGVYVLFFDHELAGANPTALAAVKWAGVIAGAGAVAALVALFVLAGDPARFSRTLHKLETVLPSRLAGLLARFAEKFAIGLGAIRRPSRLAVALAWSLPLWLVIAAGIWAVAVAFELPISFFGSFLLVAFLTIGVTVPTPGAIGGFHEAFRLGATAFFGAPNDAAVGSAIVLHLLSFGPALLLGLFFAAHEGLNLGGMRRLVGGPQTNRASP